MSHGVDIILQAGEGGQLQPGQRLADGLEALPSVAMSWHTVLIFKVCQSPCCMRVTACPASRDATAVPCKNALLSARLLQICCTDAILLSAAAQMRLLG